MKTNKEKAETIFDLIDQLNIEGKSRLISVMTEKMVLDFNLKNVPEHHLRQRGFSANKRLLEKTEKIFAYRSESDEITSH